MDDSKAKESGGIGHRLNIYVYQKQLRCVVEFATPAWTSNLKQYEARQIERVQKAALAIIFQDRYESYEKALQLAGLTTLSSRRKDICLKFAKNAFKNPKYQHWFCLNPASNGVRTRSKKPQLKPVLARTGRFKDSPISYLTNLLNEDRTK